MKTYPSAGQLRERPDQCEVGDWVTARSRPEWDQFTNLAHYSSTRSGIAEMTFRLEAYINGRRLTVWQRVS